MNIWFENNGDLVNMWQLSLGPEQILGNLLVGNLSSLSEKISDGKSGSFFFYSHDGKFLVKTIHDSEKNTLKQILPYYYAVCIYWRRKLADNVNSTCTRTQIH